MGAHTVAPMTEFDPSDTDLQEAARIDANKHAELEQQRAATDFLWMMNDPRGRRIIWRQLAAAGVFRTSFTPDAMQMAFNEGHRSHGLRLIAQVHALCPDLYPTMMKENS